MRFSTCHNPTEPMIPKIKTSQCHYKIKFQGTLKRVYTQKGTSYVPRYFLSNLQSQSTWSSYCSLRWECSHELDIWRCCPLAPSPQCTTWASTAQSRSHTPGLSGESNSPKACQPKEEFVRIERRCLNTWIQLTTFSVYIHFRERRKQSLDISTAN